MARVALTLWFTVTALLGPGVCCCSLAAAPHPATPPAADSVAVASPARARPCCHKESPPRDDQRGQCPEPARPSKCPCEHGKQVKTLPPVDPAATDHAAALKWIDGLFAGLLTSSALDPRTTDSPPAVKDPPAVRPAGRDLLAAYSLLRC